MNDARGTPVSCSNPAQLEGYEASLRSYQNYVGDPIAKIDAVLTEHEDFVLGHVFRSAVLMTSGERRVVADADRSLRRAETLAGSANDREKGLIRATRLLVNGDWHAACAAYDAVLAEHPRDIFALQTAHLFDFYRGDALNLRNRVARVLSRWDVGVPAYSYLLGMHAFGLEECNQYAEAESAGRRALELEPRDGWAVHAVTHVMEMTGRIDDGIAWLEGRRDDWAPDNGFAFHNFWHLALYRLDRQEYDAVLALYDSSVYPRPLDLCVVLVDATSLLWRLNLEGVSLGARPDRLADVWRNRSREERGYYAFNDVHAVMAFCLANERDEARDLIAHLEQTAPEIRGSNGNMTRNVGLPLAKAMLAFADGDYAATIELALPVRDRASAFGGSHAQRDVITLTLIEAALRSNRHSLARHLIAERTTLKPASAWGWRLLARAN
ncbi:MAG TPA: tetratricopeptide repeat protein [Pseudomonadales bacterium]|nr:tetratricopeptide repeat protein [Pseudomonadales bacterium]